MESRTINGRQLISNVSWRVTTRERASQKGPLTIGR